MTLMYTDYEQKILELTRRLTITSTLGSIQTNRLVFGGTRGSGGGEGGPIQPFIGKIKQTNVTYDDDEFATVTVPSGDNASLLHNLNRIRVGLAIKPLYTPINYTVPSGLESTLLNHLEGIDDAIPSGGVGGGSGDPWPLTTINVDLGGEADYTTITAGLAAASADDVLLVGPGDYSESFTIPASVTVIGIGRPSITGAVTVGSGAWFANASVVYNAGHVVTVPAIALNATLVNIEAESLGDYYALINSGIARVTEGKYYSTTVGGGGGTSELEPSEDTYMASIAPDNNYGGGIAIAVGYTGTSIDRGLLEFDLSPIGGTITAVSLWVYTAFQSGSYQIDVHRILAANDGWVEGVDAQSPHACWNDHTYENIQEWAGSVGCGTADTDYDSSTLGTKTISAGSTWYEIVLSATEVEKIRNGTYDNAGFLLKSNNEGATAWSNFYSKENDSDELYLEVTYEGSPAKAHPVYTATLGTLMVDDPQILGSGIEGTTWYGCYYDEDFHHTCNPAVGGGGAPTDAQYVTLALDGDLSDERVLTAGSGIALTDYGADGNVVLDYVGEDWKLGNTVVVSNSGDGDYTNLSDAFDAVVAGDTILVDEGTYICDDLVQPDDTFLIGMGMEVTILTSSTDTTTLQLGDNSVLATLTVRNTAGGGGSIYACRVADASVQAFHVKTEISGGTIMYGWYITGTGDHKLWDCWDNTASGLFYDSTGTLEIHGGSYLFVNDGVSAGTIEFYSLPDAGLLPATIYADWTGWFTDRGSSLLQGGDDSVIDMDERATSTVNPKTGRWRMYFKPSGLYHRSDAGVETGPLGITGAPVDVGYVVTALDADLSSERVLTGGSGINITDYGADSNIVIDATGAGGGAPTDAGYIVTSPDATLTDERVLVGTSGIVLVDDGTNLEVRISGYPSDQGAPTDAGYVTLTLDGDLSDERVLTAGSGIVITDYGANNNVVIDATGSGSGAPTDAQYVTLALDGDLSGERVLTAGSGIVITDYGADGNVVIDATASGSGGTTVQMSHVQAYRSSARTLTNGSFTALLANTEIYDTLGEYNTSTGVFTATYAGYYTISTMCLLAQTPEFSGSESIVLGIYKNESLSRILDRLTDLSGTSIYPWLQGTGTFYLAAEDTLEVKINQASGGDRALFVGAGDDYNWVTIDRLPDYASTS